MSQEPVTKKTTGDILKNTCKSLVQGIAGVAASERSEVILSAGRILQTMRKGKFVTQVSEEWTTFKDKGKIKDDYEYTEQHYDCLQDLLHFLDNDCPDEIRFETMKRIFFVSATETKSDRDSILPYQYLKLCRSMTSGEIIVLLAAYKVYQQKQLALNDPNYDHNWTALIVNNSGFKHREMVNLHKIQLMEKGILHKDTYAGVIGKTDFSGLTQLGHDLCEYIEHYNTIKSDS